MPVCTRHPVQDQCKVKNRDGSHSKRVLSTCRVGEKWGMLNGDNMGREVAYETWGTGYYTASLYQYGPRPLNSTRRHGHLLKSTCDMEPSDIRNKIRDTSWGIS